MEYVNAQIVKEQIIGIERLTESQKMINTDSSIHRDLISYAMNEEFVSVQIFQMRAGKLIGRIPYTINTNDINQMKIYSKEGFTIIELIVVIFLAGFLSSLSIPSVLNWKRSQDVNAYTRELSQFIRLVRKDSRRWGATCDLKVKQLIINDF